MTVSRRTVLILPGAAVLPSTAAEHGWPIEWDRILIQNSVVAGLARFDASEQMLTMRRGPEYQYHTNLRSMTVHPTRDSIQFALDLLEAGGTENEKRAFQILDRVIALQDQDPASHWYGIWGWYMEEPPPKMSPADWNWADFNGSVLLLIEHRHGGRLPAALRSRVRESIRHAALSVERRNVAMSYTNIAVKGTFVTLAAAELLDQKALGEYSRNRLVRLCREIDGTGSFAEYNSPTYARVSLTNLARMRMVWKDQWALGLAAQLEKRLWMHLGAHWDVDRRQLAGPQARAYATDIGKPAWLEKALNGRLGVVRGSDDLGADAETGIHDFRCPEAAAGLFLKARPGTQHREVFLPGRDGVRPVQGTTYFATAFSLGSINRGDFWVQRRPLLAYWGNGKSWLSLRVIKDDYDFSSALLYTVQEQGRILGLINFRSPGGDRHISLEPIVNGEFTATRLRAVFAVTGEMPRDFKLTAHFHGSRFGKHQPRRSQLNGGREVILDFLPEGGSHQVRWAETQEAWAVFTVSAGAGDSDAPPPEEIVGNGIVQVRWRNLELKGSTRVAPVADQDRVFADRISGNPVPLVRLSEDKLAPA